MAGVDGDIPAGTIVGGRACAAPHANALAGGDAGDRLGVEGGVPQVVEEVLGLGARSVSS